MAADDGRPGDEEPAAANLTRRDLLGAGLVAGVGAAATAYPLARYLSPLSAWVTTDRVEIPADSLGLWQAERVLLRGTPGFVVRTPEQIYACSGVCSHLGCIVNWNRSRRVFFCPCHGARFAPDGRVLGGPPPAPLERFDVDVAEGKIVVRLV